MTPYVNLQQEVIEVLRRIQERKPEFLRVLVDRCCITEGSLLNLEDVNKLKEIGHLGTFYRELTKSGDLVEQELEGIKWLSKIIRQQLDYSGEQIKIRNLLGDQLYSREPVGFDSFIAERGRGNNNLRTEFFSHPGVLQEGDVLACGDRLLSPPREGGNGAVLLHLTGGCHGHWISVPARIPIALLHVSYGVPPELVE